MRRGFSVCHNIEQLLLETSRGKSIRVREYFEEGPKSKVSPTLDRRVQEL